MGGNRMTDLTGTDQGTAAPADSALGRMAGRHRLAQQAQAQRLDHGLRIAFGRMAQEWPGIEAELRAVTVSAMSVAELADQVEQAMFVALLEGQGEQIGVSLICPALLAGLVEGAATGRVAGPAPDQPRPPTRTDAALVAPMIDALLAHIRERCSDELGALMPRGWVYGSFLADPRPLALMLDDGQYRMLRFTLSLGQGQVRGTWSILLPDPAVAGAARPRASGPDTDAPSWEVQLQGAVQACPAELRVILHRAQLPLGQALSLAAGDTLCIPMSAIETMQVETVAGQSLGTGRLGQARGQRAVRLLCDLAQEGPPDAPVLPKARSMTPVLRGVSGFAPPQTPEAGSVLPAKGAAG